MTITVTLKGFDATAEFFDKAAKRYPKIVSKELQTFGDETVETLKEDLLSNGFNLPPKKHPNGEPPLIDSKKYMNGYSATVQGRSMEISSKDMNDHMSNVDLGELLEYGNGTLAPRPHIRPTEAKMMAREAVLAERISDELFGGA